MRTFRFSMLTMLFSGVLAACTANQLTADEIMQRMQAARAALQTAHTVADIAFTTPDRNGTFTVEGWAKKIDKPDVAEHPIAMIRAKVLAASESKFVGTEFISDGESFWLYNPEANKVLTGNLRDLHHGEPSAHDPMGHMLRMQELLQRLLDGSDVTLESQNEQVAGHTTWRVGLTPKAETQQQLQLGSLINITLWIDQESELPIKVLIDAKNQGRLEATVTRLDLNQPLADDVFRFTPPAGAEVINAADIAKRFQPQVTTLDNARAEVSFPLLALPDLPSGVQLDEVQVLRLHDEAVIQNFSGALNFSLVQSQGELPGNTEPPAGVEVQRIEVRGQDAELITGGSGAKQGTLLRWREDGVILVIAGTLTPDQAIQLAESLR